MQVRTTCATIYSLTPSQSSEPCEIPGCAMVAGSVGALRRVASNWPSPS